jgi:hypothetical protein
MTRNTDSFLGNYNKVSRLNMILFSTSRPAELAALTSELRQIVYSFEISIEGEESRAQISDLANANYPLAARILRVRRDNLLATLSTLENYSANNA